ncbi:hypothetical protein [Marisediminicola sp. LYQ85]|uniref:hypothetical protein n=1 Tax=Marisediminicola sp. LYQ85 TaxID=3391062 RepID=UPI0039831BE7
MDETAASATLTASLEPRRGHPAAKAGRFLANVVGAAVFGSVDTVADTDLWCAARARERSCCARRRMSASPSTSSTRRTKTSTSSPKKAFSESGRRPPDA